MSSDHSRPATSSLQHYYVAVSTAIAKLESLVELITALRDITPLSLVVCCGSRDALDELATALCTASELQLWCLHADLSERDVETAVQVFYQAAGNAPPTDADALHSAVPRQDGEHLSHVQRDRARHEVDVPPAVDSVVDKAQPRTVPAVLLTTDPPLRVIPKALTPLAPTLLINYDLPRRKEDYSKRISAVLGSRTSGRRQRIAVNFVEAGKVAELRLLEGFAEREVREMPVRVADIFAPASVSTPQFQQPAPVAALEAAAIGKANHDDGEMGGRGAHA